MRMELANLICCPQVLQVNKSETKDNEIWEGSLICEQCATTYPTPLLYIDNEKWISNVKETDGWVTYHKDLGTGRGWEAKEFTRYGCRIVALVVAPDENIELGWAKALMDHGGIYSDRLISDDESFFSL